MFVGASQKKFVEHSQRSLHHYIIKLTIFFFLGIPWGQYIIWGPTKDKRTEHMFSVFIKHHMFLKVLSRNEYICLIKLISTNVNAWISYSWCLWLPSRSCCHLNFEAQDEVKFSHLRHIFSITSILTYIIPLGY